MKKFIKWDKKYLYWGITAFFVIAAAILFFMALNYISILGNAISSLFAILSPFVWGLIITYLLCPVMKRLEKHVFLPFTQKIAKKGKSGGRKLARGLAVLFSEIFLLAIIVAMFYLIIPQLYDSIEKIVKSSDAYYEVVTRWIENTLADYPEIESYAVGALNKVGDNLVEWLRSTILPELGGIVTNVTSGVYYAVKTIYNLIIGIIVSIYILASVENFGTGMRRLLYSLFSVDTAQKIRDALAFADRTFIGFINGKILDSAIIGLICYIFCAAVSMPYALLVSVIVGVTNVIPFFGPFIGAVPSALIILLVSPFKCFVFVIFIIILQQLDGNFIGPKILGSTTGISGFWVMFSIILGAGLFGFWGMLLGVPVFVIIHSAINASIERKLKRSGLPTEQSEYANLDHIDPITLELVKKAPEEKPAREKSVKANKTDKAKDADPAAKSDGETAKK